MRKQQGVSIVEIIVVLAIIGILSSVVISATNIRGLNSELQNATREFAGQLKQVRSKAMVTTSAYRLSYQNGSLFGAAWASNCNATIWQVDNKFNIELKGGVSLDGYSANDVIICFNSRGLANGNPTLTLRDNDGQTQQLEVFIGGGVEIK